MDKKDIEAIFPLSHQQKGMFLETLLTPGSGIHIEQAVWAYRGALNVPLFKQAWQLAIQRHAMLRTAFAWKDRPEPLQVALRSAEIPLEQQAWNELSASEQNTRLESYLRSDSQKGFDMARAPLMRLAVFQTGEAVYQIVWTLHHILMDGWCRLVVMQEVVAYYQQLVAGKDVRLEPAHSYREYLAWLKRQDLGRAEKFWSEALHGLTGPTLPGRLYEGKDEPDVGDPYQVQSALFSADETQALLLVSKRHHLTLNTLLQGMWALLLSHYSGNENVVYGTTVAGRPADLAGVETMVGLFIATLPLRVSVQPSESVWTWLKEIQARHLDLRSYEYCSEGQIHQWSEVPGSLPLFDSILVFENYPRGAESPGDAGAAETVQSEKYAGAHTKYALTLLAIPDSTLRLQLVYHRHRFVGEQVSHILEHFSTLLRGLLNDAEMPLSALLGQLPAEQIPFIRPLAGMKQPEDEANYEAPRTQTEKKLAGLFANLFNVDQIGREDNFFGRGGHSLMALQLVNRVRETFDIEIPLQASFEAPTVAELARRIEQAQESARDAALPPIERLPRNGKLPLSLTQQLLWDMLYPAQPATTPKSAAPGLLKSLFGGRKANEVRNPWQEMRPLVAAVQLTGDLNREVLVESLKLLSQRHEALRTRFARNDGQVSLVVSEETPATALQLVELSSTKQTAQALLLQERQRLFDLERENPWRVTLARSSEQAHTLILTLHPLIADAPSARMLMRDLASIYLSVLSGKPAQLPELSIQYADYAAWQQGSLSKDALQEQLDFWKQQLHGYKPLFPFKRSQNGDFQRTPHAFSPRFVLNREHADALKALSQRLSIPWTFVLAAAFQTLLYRCTHEEDIALAMAVPHRPRKALEPVAGPFANYLTLRTLFSGEPGFLDVIQQLRSTVSAALAHQDVPFDLVATELAARHAQFTPIQVLFAADDKMGRFDQPPGITFSDTNLIGSECNFVLCLLLQQDDTELSGQVAYHTEFFDGATIERFIQDFQTVLENLLNAPERSITGFALDN